MKGVLSVKLLAYEKAERGLLRRVRRVGALQLDYSARRSIRQRN